MKFYGEKVKKLTPKKPDSAYKYTGIKICYKIDKFVFEGNKSKEF